MATAVGVAVRDEGEATDGGVHLSQMALVGRILQAIAQDLAEQQDCDPGDVKLEMAERHHEAVVDAANQIVDEFRKGFRKAAAGAGISAWIASDDTGLSSRELADCLIRHAYAGQQTSPTVHVGDWRRRPYHPHDPADFGRCLRMLDAAPELREHLPKAADLSPVWAALVGVWGELEQLYREESPTGECHKLFARMRELIDGAQAAS